MRLLHYDSGDNLCLTTFSGDEIPRYAMLSHTWEVEEVTFEDLKADSGKEKAGYNKIVFCGEQARRDGLQYFWVDTCCIDKSSSAELTESINSMFRWYCGATKCYVYLSDVLRRSFGTDDKTHSLPWETAFRKSKWFTRGWTLQELIAPKSVEFFAKNEELLGDRVSLEQNITEVSGIPIRALRGSALSGFSITERMSWAYKRKTTREEDKAYSLLGIFDVQMSLIYGEGQENALKRLQEEIDKSLKGIQREDFSIAFCLSDFSGIEQFVARETELEEIHKGLIGNGSRRTIVIWGLGGIGKTQISVKYAKRHKNSYSAIFWLNINDEDSLKQSFVKVAKQILQEYPLASQLNGMDMKENLDKVVDAVKAWLNLPNNTRWLIIYDNYDNPKVRGNKDHTAVDIRKFLPESDQGSVIITTRSSQVRGDRRIHVEKLKDVKDSLRILLNESRREGSMMSENVSRHIIEVLTLIDPDAVALAEKLDGLPLALATAGAYLDQVSTSFSDYLRLFSESWLRLLEKSPDLDSYEDRALYTTWNLSFSHVEKQNKYSAKLLQLWAYFDNQDVWFELLQYKHSSSPEWFSYLIEDEMGFTEAIRVLCDHGLIEVENSSEERIEAVGYSMHSCVHSWTKHVLNRDWDYEMAELALKCLGSHVPNETARKVWLTERRMLRHALRCSEIVLKGLSNTSGLEWALYNLGLLYADLGKLKEAESMYQRALQGQEKALGPEHTSTLDTVNNLSLLYADLGKLEEAESMFQQALQGYEKAWGPEHTSTLDTVNNLGNLYTNLGKLEEAESMYQRALQGKEKAWGPEHTSTLNTVNNLGNLYTNLGKLEEAENMYQRALQGKEKAWGPEHTSTLDTVNNLGALYANLGKLEEAENMYQRALRGYEKALGVNHAAAYLPALNTVRNLGYLFERKGDIENARIMYSKALAGFRTAVGANDPRFGEIRDKLGALDAVTEKESLVDVGRPVNNVEEERSRHGAAGTSLKS